MEYLWHALHCYLVKKYPAKLSFVVESSAGILIGIFHFLLFHVYEGFDSSFGCGNGQETHEFAHPGAILDARRLKERLEKSKQKDGEHGGGGG